MDKNSHKYLPLATTGAASHDDICLWVGRALSQWELMETELLKLFSILTNTHVLTCREVFGSVTSSAGRIDMTKAAARAFFINYPKHRKLSRRFLDYIRKHAGLRNSIAHGVATGTPSGHFLMPAPYMMEKTGLVLGVSDPKYRYSDKELEQLTCLFGDLTSYLENVAQRVSRWSRKNPPKEIPPLSDHNYRTVLLERIQYP